MKKAFTIIEVIFIISILSLIIMVALPKLDQALGSSKIAQIKNDITMIREGIISYRNKMILKDESTIIEQLDDDNILLFNKILTYPIVASDEQKANSWSKLSNTRYKVWIDNYNSVEFQYDSSQYTFSCNDEDLICKELNQ
ncbi:hypothetical protein N9W00_01550 [Arcobacteraceae bacterium]|nr:hypothetical protein [Arcobacteraceae bacterium]